VAAGAAAKKIVVATAAGCKTLAAAAAAYPAQYPSAAAVKSTAGSLNPSDCPN
jgi:hypothetical protein